MTITTINQEKLFLHHILHENMVSAFDKNFFTATEIKATYEIIKDYYTEYKRVPSFEIIRNSFQEKGINIKVSFLQDILSTTLYNETIDKDRNWFVDKFNEYTIKKLVDIKLSNVIDDVRQGKIDEVAKLFNIKIENQYSNFDYNSKSRDEIRRFHQFLSTASPEEALPHLGEVFSFDNEYPESKYLFYPLLKEGQLGMIFGLTGGGKTVLAMEIANQIAKGKSDWETFRVDTPPQKVLYIDFELGGSSIKNRYSSEKFNENLKIYTVSINKYNNYIGFGKKQDIRLDRSISFIEEEAEKFGAKVIFIDNLSNIADQVEQAAEADRFISDLYGRMKSIGLTIVFLGHTPKINPESELNINQLKGSSSLTKTFETIIGFKRSLSDGDISYIKQLKSRDVDKLFESDVAKFKFSSNNGWNMEYIGIDIEGNLLIKLNGRTGRPVKYDDVIKLDVLYDSEVDKLTPKEIMSKYSISKSSLFNIKKEYKDNLDLQNKLKEYVENKNAKLL